MRAEQCQGSRGVSGRWVMSTVIRSIETRPTSGQGVVAVPRASRVVRQRPQQPVGIAARQRWRSAAAVRRSRCSHSRRFRRATRSRVWITGSDRPTTGCALGDRAGRRKGRCRGGSGRNDSPAQAGCRRSPPASAARRCRRSSRGNVASCWAFIAWSGLVGAGKMATSAARARRQARSRRTAAHSSASMPSRFMPVSSCTPKGWPGSASRCRVT